MSDIDLHRLVARNWRELEDKERRRRLWRAAGEAALAAVSALLFIIAIILACAVSGGGSMRTSPTTQHERLDAASRRARMAWVEGLKP
ncbi:MAG: hypothetical protein IKO64_05515 [Kiritimatiellae bacterium]|nr:hypothetical protein [Kiritimatiellia bacterium]